MKLPLRVHHNYYGRVMVHDADNRCILDVPEINGSERKFAKAMVAKMNRHWRWRLFGQQPFVYTREDWLFEKQAKQ